VLAAVWPFATPTLVDAAPAPPSLARRLCDALQALPETRKSSCCGTSPAKGFADACVRDLDRALRDGAVALEAEAVDACATDSATELAGCDWVTPYMPRTPRTCRGIVRGRLELGHACRSSLECRDGLHCRGVCVPPAPLGASCSAAVDALTTYLRQGDAQTRHPECAGSCVRGRCAAPVAIGGACTVDAQCAAASHCRAGRCVAGASPALGDACDRESCADGLQCLAGRCAPPKKAGEPCTQPFECEAACLSPSADKPGTCGMKCSAWPPAGYTPPAGIAAADPTVR
jgi:hypothetical protein